MARRTRLKRKAVKPKTHRLADVEHAFFRAVHNSGRRIEDVLQEVEQKFDSLPSNQRLKILTTAEAGAGAGMLVSGAMTGMPVPVVAGMVVLAHGTAEGMRVNIDDIAEKYRHWKMAHTLPETQGLKHQKGKDNYGQEK